jgi:hypothetical protein
MSKSVQQEWTHELSYMQQTVLLTAVRGPDGIAKNHVAKQILRWFRRCTLISAFDGKILNTPYAFGGGSFTGPSYEPTKLDHDWREQMSHVVGSYLQTLDELPHHFQLHLMHAAEIIGYKHPDRAIRNWWRETYHRLVHDMHLWPETEAELDNRLGDTFEGWAARNEEAGRARTPEKP